MDYVSAGLIVGIILIILLVVGSQAGWDDVPLMVLTIALITAFNFVGTAYLIAEMRAPVTGKGEVSGGGLFGKLFGIKPTFNPLEPKESLLEYLEYAEKHDGPQKLTPEEIAVIKQK